jgi:hypothetical protein
MLHRALTALFAFVVFIAPLSAQQNYIADGDFSSPLWFFSWSASSTSVGLNPTVQPVATDGVTTNPAFVVHPGAGSTGYELQQRFTAAGDQVLWVSVDFANVAQNQGQFHGCVVSITLGVVGQQAQVIGTANNSYFFSGVLRQQFAGKFTVPAGGPQTLELTLRSSMQSCCGGPVLGQSALACFDNVSVRDFCPGTAIWRGERRMGTNAQLDIFGANGAYALYVAPTALATPLPIGLPCPLLLDPTQMFVFVAGGIGTGTGIFSQTFPIPIDNLVRSRALYWQALHVELPARVLSLGQATQQAFF